MRLPVSNWAPIGLRTTLCSASACSRRATCPTDSGNEDESKRRMARILACAAHIVPAISGLLFAVVRIVGSRRQMRRSQSPFVRLRNVSASTIRPWGLLSSGRPYEMLDLKGPMCGNRLAVRGQEVWQTLPRESCMMNLRSVTACIDIDRHAKGASTYSHQLKMAAAHRMPLRSSPAMRPS